MKTKKKFFSQMLSMMLIVSLVIGNMNIMTASANEQDRSTVFFGNSSDDVYGTKHAEWVPGQEGEKAKITFDITAKKVINTVNQVTKTDIVLVLDLSGSMSTNNRIGKVKTAGKEFVKGLLDGEYKNSVQIGVVTYSKTASSLLPNSGLSNNETTINNKIDNIKATNEGTNIQAGLRKANEILAASKAVHANNNEEVQQIIVLLSDGEPTYSYQASGYDAVNQRLLFDSTKTVKGDGYYYTLSSYDSYDVSYTVSTVKTGKIVYFNGSYYNTSGTTINNVQSLVSAQNQTINVTYKSSSPKGWYGATSPYTNIRFSSNKNDSNIKNKNPNNTTGTVDIQVADSYIITETKKFTVKNNGIPTIDEAAVIKDDGTTIYTIGYDISNGSNAENVMSNVASPGKFEKASTNGSASSIDVILDAISEQVQEVIDTASGARIVDTIPVGFTVDENTLPNGVTYDNVARTLTWNLGDLKVPEDEETITKSVTIFLNLDKSQLNANVVAAAGNFVETNAGCTLNYIDSTSTPMEVGTKAASGTPANPALPLPTYDYSINYIIEGNRMIGGTIDGSSTTEGGKAFLGDKILVKSTLASLGLEAIQYKQPAVTGNATPEQGNQYLIIRSDNQANTATVTAELNRYTVTFYSKESGSQGNTHFDEPQTVVYGTAATKPATNPQKEADAQYTYQFANWSITDIALANVTSDLDVYPNFGNTLQDYTITFYRDQDAFDAKQSFATYQVKYGTNTVTAPTSPSAPTNPNSDYDYVFTGWNRTPAQWQNITGNVDVIGSFDKTLKNATVYFYDLEGNLIGEPQSVPYRTAATAPTAPGGFADKVILENEIHIFNGTWDKSFDSVSTPELHVYAQYDIIARYYTVEYYAAVGDTTPLHIDPKVEYEGASNYSGTAPTKVDSTNQYTYTFNNTWNFADGNSASNALNSVTSNMKVYAGFNQIENKFTFTFYYWDENGNDTSAEFTNISWGASVESPTVTTVSGSGFIKTFNGWAGDDYNNVKKNGSATATAAMTYAVTFIYGDNQSEIQYVPEHGDATAPTNTDKSQDAIYTYTFTGWDNTFNNITEPTTVTAQYNSTQREYTINFINDVTNETLDSASGKHYGDKVAVPTPPETFEKDGYTYTFAGWEDNIADEVTVTGDKTYRAYYTSQINQYQVKFIDVTMTDASDLVSEGDELSSASIDHNGDATSAASQAEAMIDISAKNTAKYHYTFKGWVTAPGGEEAANLTSITGNTTVYASYTREELYYTVIFMDDAAHGNAIFTVMIDGNPETDQLLPYGGTAVVPEFVKDEDTVETVYGDPYWNSDAWMNVGVNGQYDLDRVITVTLIRPSAPARYEVEFYSENGTQKFTNETEAGIYVFTYGDPITSKPADQVKDSTPTHNFTFVGWGTQPNSAGELVDLGTRIVDGPGIKLYAQFEQSDRYYTVTFLDENGSNFEGTETPIVASVLYEGTTVGTAARNMAESKAIQYADNHSTLSKRVTFLGWSTTPAASERQTADLTRITSNLFVYAINADITNEYTITYMSDEYDAESNNIFATDTAIGGTKVSFEGSEDEENTYLIRKEGPSKISESHRYIFTNWRVFADFGEESFELSSNDELLSALQSDLVLYPVFERAIKTFTVTFVDWDGKVLKTQENIPYGEGATAPANPGRADVYTSTTRTAFTFSGWDKDYSEVSEDMTITAEYTSVVYNLNPSNPGEPSTPPTATPTPIPEVIIPEVTPPAGPGADEEEVLDITDNETPQGTTKPATKSDTKVKKQDAQLPSKNKNTEGDKMVINENKTPRGAANLPKTGELPMDILYGVGMVCSLIGASVSIMRRKKNKEK